MTFDGPNIVVALLFSIVGIAYFRYGKRQGEMRWIMTGLGLMAYSYFTPTVAWNLGVGVVLSALPFVLK